MNSGEHKFPPYFSGSHLTRIVKRLMKVAPHRVTSLRHLMKIAAQFTKVALSRVKPTELLTKVAPYRVTLPKHLMKVAPHRVKLA